MAFTLGSPILFPVEVGLSFVIKVVALPSFRKIPPPELFAHPPGRIGVAYPSLDASAPLCSENAQKDSRLVIHI